MHQSGQPLHHCVSPRQHFVPPLQRLVPPRQFSDKPCKTWRLQDIILDSSQEVPVNFPHGACQLTIVLNHIYIALFLLARAFAYSGSVAQKSAPPCPLPARARPSRSLVFLLALHGSGARLNKTGRHVLGRDPREHPNNWNENCEP